MELITLIVGMLIREAIEYFKGFQENARNRRHISKDLIMPLVRIGDELVGRTYHHAISDFQHQAGRNTNPTKIEDINQLYDLYVWARFWAYTSRIRKAELSYRLSESRIGKPLLMYLDCLEASRVSIIPRSEQKLIGDAFSDKFGWTGESSFYKFVCETQNNPKFSEVLVPINQYYARSYIRRNAEALLKYVIIVHAMVETFDDDASLSSTRDVPHNKLGTKARNDLHRRVLAKYLGCNEGRCSRYSGIKKPARTT